MNKNRISLKKLGINTIGLVDTGAAISCASENFINKQNKSNLKLHKSFFKHIYDVGGEGHSVKGEVTLPLDFQGLIIPYKFYVVADLQYGLFLRDDFLIENKANIHYPSRTLYLHDGTFQVAIITLQDAKAKSTKRICIPAQDKSTIKATNTNKLGKLQIINPTEPAIVLPKHKEIANIQEVL